jgi:glycerol kinase
MAIGLDVGSSSVKAIRIDARGTVRAAARGDIATRRGAAGRVEHDPAEILAAVCGAIRRVARGAAPGEPIGIATQRSTLLFWDARTGRPITPAYSWQDLRGRAWCDRLRRLRRRRGAGGPDLDAWVAARTGLRFNAHYSAAKIAWAIDHVPGVARGIAAGRVRWGCLATWIVWRLSGGALYLLDHTNAQRTLLMGLDSFAWDPELGRAFGLDRLFDAPLLPALVPAIPGADLSIPIPGGPAARGAGGGLRLSAIVGDQQAALAGLGGLDHHDAVINYGSGAFVIRSTGGGPRRVPGLLTSILVSWRDRAGAVRARFGVEGTVNAAAVAIDWARAALGIPVRTRDLDGYLGPSPAGPRTIHFLPAVAGVAAPRWDERARPRFAGDLRGATARDRMRAVVESIACRCVEILRVADRTRSGRAADPILAAGGLTRCRTLIQAQADIAGRPVLVRDIADATALGAARLAAAGAGGIPGGSPGDRRGSTILVRPRIDRAAGEAWFRDWARSVYGSTTSTTRRRTRGGRPVAARRPGAA